MLTAAAELLAVATVLVFGDHETVAIELVLTLGLVSTVLGTASKAQNVGPLAALAVGGYIALAGLWGSPISGASMNPARSFGPDAALGDFSHYWVYVVGPLAGALIAVLVAFVLRGRADVGGATAAQGELGAVRVQRADAPEPGKRTTP